MTQLSDRYAKALLDGRSDSEIKVILADLEKYNDVLNELPDFKQIICNPLISSVHLKSLMTQVAQTLKISVLVQKFIAVLIDNDRFSQLLSFIEDIKAYICKRQNMQVAIVYSASTLSQQEVDVLKQKLQQHMNSCITIVNKLDPSILSGFRIQCGALYVDGTLNKQIDQIKHSLKGFLYAN